MCPSIARTIVAALVTFLSAISARGTPPPYPANPTSVTEPDGDVVVADVATVSGSSFWSIPLYLTLIAQGFTTNNGWTYNNNPVFLGAQFDITTYSLALTTSERVNEVMEFSLLGLFPQPLTHWLQLINSSQPVTGSGQGSFGGSQIAPYSGYWQVDNGNYAPGDGPFYDSNGGSIVPLNFSDDPNQDSPPGSYLHFWTIPAWDGPGGSIIVANQGITWGWTETPEPSPLVLGIFGILVFFTVRRLKKARSFHFRD